MKESLEPEDEGLYSDPTDTDNLKEDTLKKSILELLERVNMLEKKTEVEQEKYYDTDDFIDSLASDRPGNNRLAGTVKNLQKRISVLEGLQKLRHIEVIELRDIPHDHARCEIEDMFKKGGYYDPGEVAEKLRLDVRLVVNICNELIREGIIGE